MGNSPVTLSNIALAPEDAPGVLGALREPHIFPWNGGQFWPKTLNAVCKLLGAVPAKLLTIPEPLIPPAPLAPLIPPTPLIPPAPPALLVLPTPLAAPAGGNVKS